MHDSLRVRRLQGFGDLQRNGNCLIQRNRAAAGNPRGEILTVDELHHERVVFDAVDVGDILMVQCREIPRLAFEPRQPLRILGEEIRQKFDGNIPPQACVEGRIDFTHPAGTDQAKDFVRTEPRTGGQGHGEDSSREVYA
jgi:hypothetical protein